MLGYVGEKLREEKSLQPVIAAVLRTLVDLVPCYPVTVLGWTWPEQAL